MTEPEADQPEADPEPPGDAAPAVPAVPAVPAAPAAPDAEPVAELDVEEIARGAPPWKLRLFPDAFELQRADGVGKPCRIRRDEAPDKAEVVDGLWLRRILGVDVTGSHRSHFKLAPDPFRTLLLWWGPPSRSELLKAVRVRTNTDLGVGLVLFISSLPLGPDPASDLPARELSPLFCALGAWLILLWLVSRWRPARVAYLLDSPVYLAIAGVLLVDLFRAERSGWWVVLLVVVCFWLTAGGVKAWRWFGGPAPTRSA